MGRLWDCHPVTSSASTSLMWALSMRGGTFRSRSRGSKAEEIKGGKIRNCNIHYDEFWGGMHDFIAANIKLPGLGLDTTPPVKSLKTELEAIRRTCSTWT